MTKIAISYRRTDSDATGRLFDRLVLKYGRESVFRDIDSVPFGSDFRKSIDDALKDTDIFIAVVGPNWRGIDKVGKAKINDESDLVRIEVETALKRKIPVVPVLVGGATMPQPVELPDSLRDFSFRNAAGIDSGRNFDADVMRLIRSMDHIIQRAPARATGRKASSAAAQRQVLELSQKSASDSVEPEAARPQMASTRAGQPRLTYPVVVGLSVAIAVLAASCFWLIYRVGPPPAVVANPPIVLPTEKSKAEQSKQVAVEEKKVVQPKPAATQEKVQSKPATTQEKKAEETKSVVTEQTEQTYAVQSKPAVVLPPQPVSVPPQPTPKPPLLESMARDFSIEYMRQSGADVVERQNFIRQVYAPSLMYFGERLSNEQILDQERKFATSWPRRSYRPKLDTQVIKCDEASSTCHITGQLDFMASNPQNFKVSTGVADYELTVVFGREGPKIVEENGHVLSRTNPWTGAQ